MDLLKIILSPIYIIIIFLFIGIYLLIFKSRSKLSKYFIGFALVFLFLLSFRPFSNFLLWGLESKYSPISNFNELTHINYIVVLTAWDSDNPTVPYTSNLGYRSGLRILEAHRIYMNITRCRIIISGGEIGGKLMSKLLTLLGVPREEIIIDDQSKNTWMSAKNIRKRLSDRQFILVTSSIHLPRSMNCFMREGLKPIPAPADFSYGYYRKFQIPIGKPFTYYLPNVESFMYSHRAIYEYLGMFWYYIKAKAINE